MTSLTSSQPPHHHTHTPKYTGYHRQWFSVLPSETQPVNSQFSSTTEPISILSYNLLAQSLCNRRGTQCYLTPEQARWSFRKTKLLNEIAHLNMDIISLQEVDFYDTFWEMELQKLGYSTVFSPQFNFEKNYRPMPYGLVIGYKKDKFNLLKFKVVDYRLQALSMSKFDVNHESSCCNETSHSTSILPPMTVLEQCEMNQSGNIALLAVLQCNNDPNCGVILSNTHLYWRPESNVVRVRQELVLLHEMNELFKEFNKNDRNDLFELVFTGDFNTSPNDLPYILLTTRNPESNNGCDENGIALDENGKKFWNAFNQSEMMSGLDGYDCEQDPLVPYFPIVEWATDQCKEEFLQQQSNASMTSTSNSSDESLNVQEQYFFEQFYMDQKVKRLEHIRQCVKHFSHFPLLHSLYTQYSKCSTLTFMKEEERQRQVLNPTICNTTTLTIQDRIEAMKVHSRWSDQELYYTTFTPKYISSLDYIMVRKRAIVPTHDDQSCDRSPISIQLCSLLSIPTPQEITQGQEDHHRDRQHHKSYGTTNGHVDTELDSGAHLQPHAQEPRSLCNQEAVAAVVENVEPSNNNKLQHYIPNSIHASDHFSLGATLILHDHISNHELNIVGSSNQIETSKNFI